MNRKSPVWCWGRLAWVGVLASAVAVGCGGPKEIVFGAILDESREASVYGKSIRRGIELAVDDVNAKGVAGFEGVPVRVAFRDSKLDPAIATAAFEELVDTERAVAVIGSDASSITLELCPLAEKKQRMLLSPASSSPRVTACGSFVARNYPSDVLEAGKIADFARKRILVKRASVIAVRNEYGLGLKTEFIKSFKNMGGEIQEIVIFPDTDTDYEAMVRQATKDQPQALYLIGYVPQLTGLLEAVATVKPTGEDKQPVRLLSCGAFDSQEILAQSCEVAKGVYFPRPSFDLEDPDPKVQGFVKAFRERYHQEPDTFAAHGYDALRLLVEGVESRNSLFPSELQFFVVTLQGWKGVTGTTTFDSNGDVTTRFPRIFHVNDACQFEDYDAVLAKRSEPSPN